MAMSRELMISTAAYAMKLPEGIRWYEVDKQIVFPIRGSSGGLKPIHVLYLLHCHDYDKTFTKYAIEIPYHYRPDQVFDKIARSIIKFQKALDDETAETYNPDGGDMGREEISPITRIIWKLRKFFS